MGKEVKNLRQLWKDLTETQQAIEFLQGKLQSTDPTMRSTIQTYHNRINLYKDKVTHLTKQIEIYGQGKVVQITLKVECKTEGAVTTYYKDKTLTYVNIELNEVALLAKLHMKRLKLNYHILEIKEIPHQS